jgi:protein-disulfide isomerase
MLVILGSVAAVVIAAVGLYQWLGGPTVPPPRSPDAAPAADVQPALSAKALAMVQAEDFSLGKAGAPVTVIEYASLTCPHCADFHTNVLPGLKKDYIATGKVRMAFRNFPLDRAGLAAAMVARCAGRDRYFAMIDLFFARQRAWGTASDPISALARVAGLGGMPPEQVQTCLSDKAVERAVLNERVQAEKAFAINATPSFVINGKKYSGGMPLDQFRKAIDPLLAATAKPAK